MQYLKNVATLKLHGEKCTGCGACATVCPHRVLVVNGGKAAIARLDRCMECGACARNCPSDALEVHAGVGCAAAILVGMLTGKEPACGCGNSDNC